MINWNGELIPASAPVFGEKNRAFRYGDSVFETIRTLGTSINFWEDHYLRLMSSMRLLRMEIPLNYTMEYLSDQIVKLLEKKDLANGAARVRLSVMRQDGGLYSPDTNDVSFVISAEALSDPFFVMDNEDYLVDLFKEHYISTGLLANLKTNNRVLNVVASVYAAESEMDSLLLLNENKQVVEAISGNIFLVSGNNIKTPPLEDGCIDGIIRKQLIEICRSSSDLELEETSISPFELQKADELFITNAVKGIQPVSRYRRKDFKSKIARELLGKLNARARLAN